jgi:hypothetical protein
VEELIDPATGQWDVELVTKTFVDEEVKSILSIPVHPELDDVVAWHDDSRGLFSVRSAYKVQKEHEKRSSRRGVQTTSSGSDMDRDLWKSLWKLNCPGKFKHFLWRFAHNSLALRMGLERRGMELDTKCVMFGRLNEDGCHLFFRCKHVVPVWKEMRLESVREGLAQLRSAKKVTRSVLGMKKGERLKVVILLRQWWLERNRVREGENMRGASDLAMLAHKLSDEFQTIGKTCAVKLPVQR